MFRLWPELHAWNLRFLPFWYLGTLPPGCGRGRRDRARVLATGRAGLARARRRTSTTTAKQLDPVVDGRRFRIVKSGVALALALLLAGGGLWYAHHERGFLTFWAEWNYSGYEDSSVDEHEAEAVRRSTAT